jgi:hypothetical protein
LLRSKARGIFITPNSEIDRARQACAFFLARLSEEEGRLKALVFPGHHPVPRKWLQMIHGVIDTAKGYLEDAARSSFEPEALDRVSEAEWLAGDAYNMFREMTGSEVEHIPHQIVQPFQRWAKYLGIDNDLLFRGDHVANYELRTIDRKKRFSRTMNDPAPSLRKAVAEIKWPLLRVTVPTQALGMLPHFAVVAHELGHAIEEKILVDLTDSVEVDRAADRIAARLKAQDLPYGYSEQIHLQAILARWVNEIKADAVGLYVAGPAFYFALTGFLELSGHGYGISQTHPPTQIRRKILRKHLSVGGDDSHAAVFKQYAEVAIEENVNSPNLMRLPDNDELVKLLVKFGHMPTSRAAICVEMIPLMDQLSDRIFDAVRRKLAADSPSLIYTPARLRMDLKTHLEALTHLIAPIERRREPDQQPEPASLETILNVGWAALLGKLQDIPVPNKESPDSDTRRMDRLHELLLKAVELSEARRAWNEAHEGIKARKAAGRPE